MQMLVSDFERRAASTQNSVMLGNWATMVSATQQITRPLTEDELFEASKGQARSAEPDATVGVRIDRPTAELVSYYGITVPNLRQFARGGRIVDVGAGTSPFLNSFYGRSETIALDLDERHLAVQSRRKHKTVVADAANLDGIESDSVRVLHAAYSGPYWSASDTLAAHTAGNYVRVLEPGGIALVGPIVRSEDHITFEIVTLDKTMGDGGAQEVFDDSVNYRSRIFAAFSEVLIDQQSGADPQGIRIAGSRSIISENPAERKLVEALIPPSVRLPNFLMFRKAV